MKIINCTSGMITIDLGEKFSNAVVEALGERLSNGFAIYTKSLKQLKPIQKDLTEEEKQKIRVAISAWNSSINTLKFM